jgi:hypothetical protein
MAACGEDAAPPTSPGPSASTADGPSPSATATAEPSSLPAGDLPRPLSLEDVRARTIEAEPFADFTVASSDGVWVSGVAPGAVRYDARGRVTARTPVPGDVVQALAAAGGDVLVPSLAPDLLLRVDAVTGAVRDRVRLPASPLGEATVGAEGRRAYVLVDPLEPTILVVEGAEVVDRVKAPDGAVAVRAGFGSLWVPTTANTVERYSLDDAAWTSIPAGPEPRFLDVGAGAVWVMNQGDGSVTRIDPASGESEQIAVTGERIGGGDLTVGAGAVWLRTDSSVLRIAPTGDVTHLVELPPGSASAAATEAFLLVSNHDHDVVHLVPLPLPVPR